MRDIDEAGARVDLGREVDALRRDIEQLDRLLGDAVVRLTDSFESIASLTVAGSPAVGVAASIATNVDKALTALQFHDIASQLLRRVCTRLDLVDGLAHVASLHDRPVAEEVESKRDRAGRSQITQTTMAVGTVELF